MSGFCIEVFKTKGIPHPEITGILSLSRYHSPSTLCCTVRRQIQKYKNTKIQIHKFRIHKYKYRYTNTDAQIHKLRLLRHKDSFYFQSDQWSVTIFAFQRHQWMPSKENVWTCNKVIGELLCLFFLVKPPTRRRPHLLSSPRTTCHLQIRTLWVSQLGSTLKRVMASAIDKKGRLFSQSKHKINFWFRKDQDDTCVKKCAIFLPS